jgi:hypothetical protein
MTMDGSVVLPEEFGGEFVTEPVLPGFGGCGVPLRSHWASFEYLLWWRKGQSLPPLVTTSPDDTPQEEAGVLGFPDTFVLFGDDTEAQGARPGGRLVVGLALDPLGYYALEGRFFSLGESAMSYSAASDGSPILARPFLDDVSGDQASLLLAYPDFTTHGVVSVTSQSDVQGGSVLYRWCVNRAGLGTWDLVGSYEFSRIDENLTIAHSTEAVDIPTVTPGTVFQVRDEFDTTNEFHGGAIGLAYQQRVPGWNLEVLGKIAFGNMHEVVTVSGQTVITVPPDPPDPPTSEGLLAQGVNVGSRSQDSFAVVPEISANLVHAISPWCDVRVGYTCVYWSRVAQPADQIDPELRVPTTQFAIQESAYWVQGFNFGAELRF